LSFAAIKFPFFMVPVVICPPFIDVDVVKYVEVSGAGPCGPVSPLINVHE
jgi:hypothetical protein